MAKRMLVTCCLTVLSLIMLVLAPFTHAEDPPFIKSSTAFYNEADTFRVESNQLIDNTQEVDTFLLNFENALAVPHNVATALKQLNDTLAVVKQAIVVAKQVPQTRDKAQKLEKNLDSIKPPVANAAEKAAEVDRNVEPVRNAASKATAAVETTLENETALRAFAVTYLDLVEKLSECADTKPALEQPTIGILDGSTKSFKKIDQGIKPVNQAYATTVAAPEKTLKAATTKIEEKIKQLEQLLKSVNGLQGQLNPLATPLAELKKVLDQSVGFSFAYPCGTKMCSQSTPYPCGVKICKKYGAKYPCGTKICHKEVPFPCGVNTCSEKVSISVGTVINGADAVEQKIEALLSSTAWEALKVVGVKKYVDELQSKANSLVNPILKKFNLDISTTLPSLDVSIDPTSLTNATHQLTQLAEALTQIGKKIDMSNTTFAPEIKNLDSLQGDITGLLKTSGCQTAAPKAAPLMQKRIIWKKGNGK